MTTEPFGNALQEKCGYTVSNQDYVERSSPVKVHAHTCLSSLNPDTNSVRNETTLVTFKTSKEATKQCCPQCLCSKALPWGSCKEGTSLPSPLQQSPGYPMDGAEALGLNDTPLLAPVLMLTTENDNPLLAPGKTESSKTWLLQEDGSYKPVFITRPAHRTVSSMIPLSNDKPVGPGVSQTWGIIATLIKQQEQLNVSLLDTVDYSKDGTTTWPHGYVAALSTGEDISDADDLNDPDADDTLDTEHDVFKEFMPDGDDPDADVLDQVTIEGSVDLRGRIRVLLEKYRDVFATTLDPEPARIPAFELEVDIEKWEQFSNRGPPRVQSPAKQAEILKQVDELLRTGIIEPSTASYYSQVILASKPNDEWRFCIDFRKLN